MKIKLLPILLSMFIFFGVVSCDSNEDSSSNPTEGTEQQSRSYTLDEIQTLNSGDLSAIEVEAELDGTASTSVRANHKKSVKSVIIKTPTEHPSKKGEKVVISAVILFPGEIEAGKAYQFVIAAPPTYTHNGDAPSSIFKNRFLVGASSGSALSSKLWALTATDKVVVVLDYLGYGASHGQCDHPYLDQKVMVKSTIDVIGAAKEAIKNELKIELKEGAYVTGYSQGAWVANSIVYEVETNSAKYDWSVKMLLPGGTPANLNDIATHTFTRRNGKAVSSYLLPLTVFGYAANNYPDLKKGMKDLFLEPYDQKTLEVFKGDLTSKYLDPIFPNENKLVYTHDVLSSFATNSKFAYLRNVLYENSLKPWKNKCQIVAYHGFFDATVPKNQALNYYRGVRKMGGNSVQVKDLLLLPHTMAFVPYFSVVNSQINEN